MLGCISYIVKMHYYSENLLLYSGALFRQTKCIFMMTEEGPNKIINFMTPGEGVLVLRCGHLSFIVKRNKFFKNLHPYSRAQIRQIEGIVIMFKEGFTKTVNLFTPRAEVLVLGRGHISHIVKTHSFFQNLFFSIRHRSNKLRI